MHMVLVSSEFLYEFPATTRRLVHGICAYGFESVSATSDAEELTYETVENFQDGMSYWSETGWSIEKYVSRNGFCTGGTYFRPSKLRVYNNGNPTNISIRGSVKTGASPKICYFTGKAHYNEDGGWSDILGSETGELPGFKYENDDSWDPDNTRETNGVREVSKVYCSDFNTRVTLKMHL